MGQRRIGQDNSAEALLAAGGGANRRLERIAGLIDWAPLERLLSFLRAPTGLRCYPPPALFRALLLTRWYWLSDPGLEEALAYRLWFRRCCGFGLDDGSPDETTLCRFRATLAERGLAEALFAELNRQLDVKGLMLKAGTLIDATLVEAAVARPPRREGEVSTKDREAFFTRRGQRSFFGFQAHVAVDLGSDLIRDAVLTGADIGDSLAADGLVQGDEASLFMDKAHNRMPWREALAAAGIVVGIYASRPCAPPSHRLAALDERGAGADPKPGRAHLRHPETQLRLAPCPLSRPAAQRRQSASPLHSHEPPPRRTDHGLTGEARQPHDRQARRQPSRPFPGRRPPSITRSGAFRRGLRRSLPLCNQLDPRRRPRLPADRNDCRHLSQLCGEQLNMCHRLFFSGCSAQINVLFSSVFGASYDFSAHVRDPDSVPSLAMFHDDAL
jgi:IS5 family transposase